MDIRRLLRQGQSQLTVEEANRRTTQENAAILDVCESEEWRARHIPGAIHIPLGELEQRLSELPRDRPVVTACRSGNRSAGATRILRERGYDAANLAGGIKAWRRARLPIEPPKAEVI
jgi:rhodanese-related sulfurtransferase